MRRDLRPYRVKHWARRLEAGYADWFIQPQLDHLGSHCLFMKPWYFKAHGPNIRLGNSVHVIGAVDRRVSLTVWAYEGGVGSINIGEYALLCPGVRIDSACRVTVGRNSMLAASCYLTDADWHDLYDRTRPIGQSAPILLEDNVWLGDGTTVCKGVTIGRNSVIGAGSVVATNIPANVIAAGNPASVIRPLDGDRTITTRESMLAEAERLAADTDRIDRYLLGGNRWSTWLRNLVKPDPGA